MNDSMNNKELVAVGHDFAKAMSCDTPIIEIAKMMSRLAERLDCTTSALRETTKQRDALAAESGQMLRLLTNISENHDEYVNQDEYLYAGVPMDYVSEINMYVSRDVEAENPFKETDAFLAEVRAQAWIEAKDFTKSMLACDSVDHLDFLFDGKVQQLRQGGAV
ncbi:hypothetical protein D3C80_800250 [compost metagenome]